MSGLKINFWKAFLQLCQPSFTLEFERQSLLIVNSSAVSSDPTSQNRINGLSNNHGSVTAMASSSLAASLSFHEQFCKPSLLPKKVVVISISESLIPDLSNIVSIESFPSSSLMATLHCLAKYSVLYLLVMCPKPSDESTMIDRLNRIFVKAGLVESGFPLHHLLICSTNVGKVAIARQLEPALFFESDPATLKAVEPHLLRVVVVGSNSTFIPLKASTLTSKTIASFFDMQSF